MTHSGNGLSSSARFFSVDGVQQDFNYDGSYNANSNQTTIGGVGTNSTGGDPNGGCYLGHGVSEGSYEGWYQASGPTLDSQGYTTWVK